MIDTLEMPVPRLEATSPARRPVIVLYGTGGLYNYGCEAIVRGTTLLLKEEWPQACVVYLSPRADDDRARLGRVPVSVLPRQWYSRRHPAKWFAKAAKLFRLPVTINTENLEAFRLANAVLSIGGDLYTLGFDSRRYPKWLLASGQVALDFRRPFVVWGASIGPFESNADARRAMTAHLRKVDLITARDPDTVSYLTKLGITHNVSQCADPAFMVNSPAALRRSGRGLRIGVNYSPLARVFAATGTSLEELVNAQATVLADFARQSGAEIVLIPHVVCDFDSIDDDLRYAKRLLRALRERMRNNVTLIDGDPGYCGLRDTLLSCDIVIAARMHCAINAMSLGIPVLLVSYSAKAAGMARYVFGHGRWAIPFSSTCDNALAASTAELLQQRDAVHAELCRRLPQIKSDARRSIVALKRIIEPGLSC